MKTSTTRCPAAPASPSAASSRWASSITPRLRGADFAGDAAGFRPALPALNLARPYDSLLLIHERSQVTQTRLAIKRLHVADAGGGLTGTDPSGDRGVFPATGATPTPAVHNLETASSKGGPMRRVVVDEIHLRATVDGGITQRRMRSIVVTIAHKSFIKRLRCAVRAAVAEFPQLKAVRWQLTR